VVVDARALGCSGIGRYLEELLLQWLAEPPFAALTLLGDPDRLHALVAASAGALPVTVLAHDGAFYTARAQRSWLRVRRRALAGAAAAFFPHWDAPLVGLPAASVVTVHDLIHFRVAEAASPLRRAVAGPVLRRVVTGAGRVVCGSEASRGDLVAMLPDARDRVRVIPYGVSDRFRGAPPAGAGPVEGPYLLCVGNQKPHKNLAAAVDVLARLRGDEEHAALRLVVVGRRFPGGGVAERARARGVEDAVVELGEVDDATLHRLYAGCTALLFPSRYEGFGLPVVEAMAAGAPVIASSTAAVAEAVDGVWSVYAPDDVAGMTAQAEALLAGRADRERAQARGRARAAALSWATAARETARVLGEVADGRAPA
jgi:glycosyltransferase involved in cell wall biosynthesis